MDQISSWLQYLKEAVWGAPLLLLLLGTGVWLTCLLRGMQFRYFRHAMKLTFAESDQTSSGDISHFESLMTSLAGAIGTGTIVGVSTAIAIGGLGAIFWMWVTALLGMATKYAESLLAVKFRTFDSNGEACGGPMQYMEQGLGWKRTAWLFALLGAVAAIGTGNLVQVNAMADAMQTLGPIDPWASGAIIAFITGMVILGGVKSIGRVSSILVPSMALAYLAAGSYILLANWAIIPSAFLLIIQSAFEGQSVLGGFSGATVAMAIQMGVSRSIFSNEAGLGISTIAAAAARTDSPSKQGLITMTGALFSTVIICTMTGLVIAVTGVQGQLDANGAMLSGVHLAIAAFNSSIMGGSLIVSIGLILFAFTTVIAWAYYGEKCFEYMLGPKSVRYYRILFTLIIVPAAALKMELVWNFADIMNGLMVIPNLFAIVALRNVIREESAVYLNQLQPARNLS